MGHRMCTWEGMRGPDTQYRDDGIRGPGTREQRWALRKQRDATRGKMKGKEKSPIHSQDYLEVFKAIFLAFSP